MKNRIIALLFLVGALSLHGISQIPGFLGKKFLVEAGINTLPNLNGLLWSEGFSRGTGLMPLYSSKKAINWNTGLHGKVGFTVSRRTVLVVAYSRKKYTTILPLFVSSDLVNDYDFYSYTSSRESAIVTSRLSFGGEFFIGSSVAPVGRYFEAGITIDQVRPADSKNYNIIINKLDEYRNFVSSSKTNYEGFKSPGLYLGIGRRKTSESGVYISTALRAYLPLGFRNLSTEFSYNYVDYGRSYEVNGNTYREFYENYSSVESENDAFEAVFRKYHFANNLLEGRIAVGIMF